MIPLASDLLPFPGADAVGRLFGVRQPPTQLFFIGPHCECPGVVVVAVDKIAERCKQATESLSSDRSRENDEEPTTRATPLYEVIVVSLGAVGSAATWRLARLGTKVLRLATCGPGRNSISPQISVVT